ncbi:MAG TPA: PAS domain S-box protein [Stenomitos sp.]
MSQPNRTALIVDNSSENRELYRRYLLLDSEYSYRILEATLGRQGLELGQQHQPDVVLVDYRLPDLDGLEFLVGLHSSTQRLGLPVIVVTGQGDEAIAVQAIKVGAQDYLVKDQITPARLKLAVDRAIEAVQLRTLLQQRVDRDRVVAKITRQSHQFLNLDQILQATVTEVRQFLHTDRVLVLRLEPDGNGTVITESVGAEWRSLLSLTIRDPCFAQNYLGRNQSEPVSYDPTFAEKDVKPYHQGQVTALSNIQDSRIDPCHVELLAQFQVKANLVVPILYDDQVWGLLIAHHCAISRTWQPLEIDLLQELATQVGIAIRQRELYQQAQNELAQRQQVEAELRESEERLRLALKASRMGMWDWNFQTGVIQWSDNLEALFGLEPGEFNGSFEMFVSRLHPDDRDRVLAAINHAIATGEDYDIEFRVVYPNGRIRWALSQGKVFYDQNGQPLRMAGNDIDITERKRAAEALQDSEERFRQLAENIDAVFWMQEVSENRISYVSSAYERLWGLNPQELYENQQAWVNYLYPEDSELIARAFQNKAAVGHFDEEYRIVLPDGRIRWVRNRCFPLRDEAGEIYRFAGIAEDITDRKQIEEMRRLQAQILDQTHDTVVSTDLNGYLTSWNKGAERVFGYAAQEVLGQHVARLYPPDRHEFLENQVIAPLKAKGEHEVEVVAQCKSGDRIDLLLSLSLLRDERQNAIGMIGFSMDITERKRSEQALQQSEELFRTSIENMLDCFGIYRTVRNEQGQIVDFRTEYVNDAACLSNQMTREEQLGRGLCELLPGHRDSGLFDEYCQVVKTGQSLVKESLLYEDKYGQQRLVRAFDIRVAKLGDGIIATWRDVTDRIHTQLLLQESEARLKLAYKATRSGLWDWDITSNSAHVSEEYCHLFGLDPAIQNVTYEQWLSHLHPDDRASASEGVSRAIEQRQEYYEADYRILYPVREAGSNRVLGVRWLASRGQVFYDAAGNAVRMLGNVQDITERKQVQESLRQSEEFKRRMLESSSDCIKLLDLDGRLLYINTGGMCLLEIDDLASYINTAWTSFWQDDDRKTAEVALTTAKAGELCRFQGFSPTATGTIKWWDVVVTPIFDTAGHVVQLLVTSRDITERKQAEEALRESEERFRTLADNISQLAWMADANGWIFWYNKRWLEYTGTTLEEMQGWGWQKVHHPDHVDRVVQYIRHCFETGQLWEDTFPLRGQDGQYRWFLSRAIPIKDEKGRIVCWFGTNTDIDDRKQAEEALRQSEERYRCLAELIPQLVWTANAEGELLDVNQRWSDFTGLTLEQVHTIGWEAVVHPEDVADLVQKWSEAVQQGTSYQAEGRTRRADGVYRWHLHQAIGQKNDQGHIVKWFGTATDIDAQKQLEVERDRLLHLEQTARVEAERANRIKDEFLAILSHELRSPLNPILGWTKLLQTRKFDATKTAEALATIERNAKLQTQLIDDLLDVAKILRGKLSFNTAPVNLAFVIESAIDTVRTAAISKSILLHSELPHLGQVSGDDARLQQIVWNLLSNAIKFTPKGGRVDIKLEQVGDQAQLSVRDTGKGINPEFLPYIFESFRQEDVSTTRKYGGLGLGLAIVRSLVEAHGGTISAESPGEGQGATFIVRLPLLDAEPQIDQTDQFSEHALNLNGIRVLTVDDEPDVRELFSVLLTEYGAEVLTVASATEVLATLESFQPDVLVSDIGLPEMDGYTLLQQVRSLPAEKGGQIPAIALTAYARGEDRERCLACGFQQHISKPVDIEMLVQAVSNLARAN